MGTRRIVGLILMIAAVVLPPAIWFGGGAILNHESPNQDAMQAKAGMYSVGLGFCASVIVGAVMFIVGFVLFVRSSSSNS